MKYYVIARTVLVVALVLAGVYACNARAMVHNGSSSLANGVIYKCPNNHTVDVFGDEDAPAGLSASVDRQPALPMVKSISDPDINVLFFGMEHGQLHLTIAQKVIRTLPGGDHMVQITMVEGEPHSGKQGILWAYDCKAE